MTGYGTPYAESEVFLATMQGDDDEARKILRDSLPGELAELEHTARRLIQLIREVRGV